MDKELSVLYVEDDDASRQIIKFLLTREIGLSKVLIWEDSSDFQAKAELLDPKPDVVFLDIHIKPLNGFEMLTVLRSLPTYKETIIVAMTASVMYEEIQLLKDKGFDGAIGKPINHETFADIFDKILSGESIWRIRH